LKNTKLSVAIPCTTLMAVMAVPAIAQTSVPDSTSASSAGELQEIVVNAQRRKESLQDVPITVEAFSQDQLKVNEVTNVTDLGVVTPGMVAASQFGYFQPHLRGVGTTAPSSSVENPVAVYVDGVYYGMQAGTLFALEGIDHLEIDKGPQGTLFGRNATGGLIQIITKDPQQQFSGSASLTGGNYGTIGGSLYMTGGITSDFASSLSVYYQNQTTGFGTNYFNGLDVNKAEDFAIREKNLWTPTANDTIMFAVDYEQDHSSPVLVPAPGTTPLGGPPYTGPRWSADGYFQPYNDSHQGGVSVKYTHDFGFASLESTTAYLRSGLNTSLDGTLVVNPAYALNIGLIDQHGQFTQEVDLRSKADSPITWTTGVFWYDAHAQFNPVTLLGGLLAPLTSYLTYSNARDQSVAVFGQATKEIFDATNLTLGLRETIENKTFSESQFGGNPDGTYDLYGNAVDQTNHTSKPT
jgi:iron complex outermembrane receptor protein